MRVACLRAMALSGKVEASNDDLEEALAAAMNATVLTVDEATTALQPWQSQAGSVCSGTLLAAPDSNNPLLQGQGCLQGQGGDAVSFGLNNWQVPMDAGALALGLQLVQEQQLQLAKVQQLQQLQMQMHVGPQQAYSPLVVQDSTAPTPES